MQVLLLFMAAAAVIGARGVKPSSPISRALLIAVSVALATALASRRLV